MKELPPNSTRKGKVVRSTRAGGIVEKTKGAFNAKAKSLSAEEMRKAAEKAIADAASERGQA